MYKVQNDLGPSSITEIFTSQFKLRWLFSCALARGNINNLARNWSFIFERTAKTSEKHKHKCCYQNQNNQNSMRDGCLFHVMRVLDPARVIAHVIKKFHFWPKKRAISRYFVRWSILKFCMLYSTTHVSHITKNKKFYNGKKQLSKKMSFLHFLKMWHYRIFFIFC